ncbi:MAG TPA: L-aspartate oxidase [Polyangiaceae bacterium]|nr:L-aspartate oxidase [Polyangiaceae bacterium]
MSEKTDYLVLGSGVAGLSFALHAAEHGEVLLLTKREPGDSATSWAQGGVAAVLSPEDSFERHAEDTAVAGAGLCHDVVVDLCVREAPAAIRWLADLGARFSEDPAGEFDLGREGGHTQRRIVHAGDITGREIQRALWEAVRASPNIRVLDWHMGIDLITLSNFGGPDRCVGAYVLDERRGVVKTILARATVLATGGAGKVYLYTSNPDVATGDGVAMAYRAGAEIANMEFYQFHPTVLYEPKAKSFLVSEALRGEGGILRLPDGEAFMRRHHPMADLAPRDVVARAIDYEMKRTGSENVLLDMTACAPDFLRNRFPNIYAECLHYGIDITVQPLPVVPAAHYMCGGVTSDLHGRTTLPGLWVVGETACTGLHGANRLASNSLLEGLVFARRAASRLASQISELRTQLSPRVPEWQTGSAVPSDEAVIVSHNWDELRRTMWNYVGIVRSDARLRRAARRVALFEQEIREYYWKHLVTRDLLELRNIATVAELIIASASSRHESRGLHYTTDYPETSESYVADTVMKRGVLPHLRGH